MAEEFWGIVVVSTVSIVSILITHFLTFRSTKNQIIFQARAGYIQEEYRDLLTIFNLLTKISFNLEKEKSVATIQKIVDERPYNLPYGFLVNWCLLGMKKLLPSEFPKETQTLRKDLEPLLQIYTNKYHKEVMGSSDEELEQYREALKGTYREQFKQN